MKTLAVIFNIAIFTVCGYLYGFHQGANLPQADKVAIEQAIHLALAEK